MSAEDAFQRVLGRANPDNIARMVAFVTDVVVVVDPENRVRDVSTSLDTDTPVDVASWKGRPFGDLVAPESAGAVRSLLASTRAEGRGGAAEIIHPSPLGDVSVRYAAASLADGGDIILMGSPSRRRPGAGWPSDTLYRSLWEFGVEPALVVQGRTGEIRDSNRAASAILGETVELLRNMRFADVLDPAWRGEATSRLRGVLSSGRPDRMTATARHSDGTRLVLTMEPSRTGEQGLLVVRLQPAEEAGAADSTASLLPQLIRESPDPVLLVDRDGTLVWTNDAFLAAVGAPAATLAVGRRIDEFLHSSTDRDLTSLLGAATGQGRIAVEGLRLEGLSSTAVPVDAMLVDVSAGSLRCFGLVLRLRSEAGDSLPDMATRLDLTALTDLVGRTPMKDLVQNTTDVVEKMCIEAALRLTGNNRSAAARALGLSRQAFYLKLRRFGLADTEE